MLKEQMYNEQNYLIKGAVYLEEQQICVYESVRRLETNINEYHSMKECLNDAAHEISMIGYFKYYWLQIIIMVFGLIGAISLIYLLIGKYKKNLYKKRGGNYESKNHQEEVR